MYNAHNKDLEAWESLFEFIIRFWFPQKNTFFTSKKRENCVQKIKIFPYQTSIKDIPRNFSRSESLPLYAQAGIVVPHEGDVANAIEKGEVQGMSTEEVP